MLHPVVVNKFQSVTDRHGHLSPCKRKWRGAGGRRGSSGTSGTAAASSTTPSSTAASRYPAAWARARGHCSRLGLPDAYSQIFRLLVWPFGIKFCCSLTSGHPAEGPPARGDGHATAGHKALRQRLPRCHEGEASNSY